MWIFSVIGFFSVTQDQQNPARLQVRARIRGDLDNLRQRYLPTLSATVELPYRDYPYRAYTTREDFAATLGRIVLDVTYSNFKDEVLKRQGLDREKLYAQVWGVMNRAEQKLAEAAEIAAAKRRPFSLATLAALPPLAPQGRKGKAKTLSEKGRRRPRRPT